MESLGHVDTDHRMVRVVASVARCCCRYSPTNVALIQMDPLNLAFLFL